MIIQPNGADLQAVGRVAGWHPAWSPDAAKFAFAQGGDYVYNVSGYGVYEFNLSHGTTRALVQLRGLRLAIDIMAGISPKLVSLKDTKSIRVAILAHSAFDPVRQVDRASITFGRTGEESSLASCAAGGVDLVCDFRTAMTGFRLGDTQAILRLESVHSSHDYSTGRDTTERVRREGRGAIRIVP